MQASVTWNSGMSFTGHMGDHQVVLDSSEEHGGTNKGPRPKQLVLSALCGCTGMDVVSILRKMKIDFAKVGITADAQVSEKHPKVFTSVHVTYRFSGENLPHDKVRKAVELSEERYCSVIAMMRKNCPVDYDIRIE